MDDIIEAVNQVMVSVANMPPGSGICLESSPDPASLAAVHPVRGHAMVNYGPGVEKVIGGIEDLLPESDARRWQAIKLPSVHSLLA